jgi:hypothetical protein
MNYWGVVVNNRNGLTSAAVLVISAVFVSLAGVSSTVPHQQSQATLSAQHRQLGTVAAMESIATTRIIQAGRALVAANITLSASDGHTLADSTRGTLSDLIVTTDAALERASVQLAKFSAAASTEAGALRASRAKSFATTGIPASKPLATVTAKLTAAGTAVLGSEAALTAQLQAQAQAQAAAAAAAAAAARYYHRAVWTSGFQAQLDDCRGAVNLSPTYHVAVIGEKWQCGGSRFPRAGSLVILTGVISGTYRVGPVVAVLNAYVDRASDIPRGYELLYQTCRNGDAHTEIFTQLTRVG